MEANTGSQRRTHLQEVDVQRVLVQVVPSQPLLVHVQQQVVYHVLVLVTGAAPTPLQSRRQARSRGM